jgi:hypothetical protein
MSDAHTGTRPISEKDGLDTGRLAAWMKTHVAGFSGDLQVEKFKGGQSNPTFMLTASSRNTSPHTKQTKSIRLWNNIIPIGYLIPGACIQEAR